jgi:hypothetical protein
MNYEAAYLVKLEGIVTAMGGVVPPMTTPTSFQARSLQLLDAISAASGGGGGGFTFDQTAEPVGPAAGATWRERSANGRILRDWEWDAVRSLWVSELIFAETTQLTNLNLPTSTHGILLETASLLTYFSAAFIPTVANDLTIQGRVAGNPGGFSFATFLSPFTLSSTGLSFAQWENYLRVFPANVLIPANRLGLYVNGSPAIQQTFNLVVFDVISTGTVPTRSHQASAAYRYYR